MLLLPYFVFTVYSGIEQADSTGKVPFPAPDEKLMDGHAIVALGYDYDMVIENAVS
jgi:C1A family cysteine protease